MDTLVATIPGWLIDEALKNPIPSPSIDKHEKVISSCGYMSRYVDPERLIESVNRAIEALKHFEFDAIAFRGCSGMMMGPMIAVMSNKTMLMVRKPSEKTHSYMSVEGDWGARTYIIVDDFVDSGTTAKAIQEQVRMFAPHATCLGVLEVSMLGAGDETPQLNTKWM